MIVNRIEFKVWSAKIYAFNKKNIWYQFYSCSLIFLRKLHIRVEKKNSFYKLSFHLDDIAS